MIRWSFWIDSWEHPFSAWSLNTSVKAFVEPAPTIRDYLPPPKLPPTPPAASVRQWSDYELAVIGYYKRFGYVDVYADRAIIQNYYENRIEGGTRDLDQPEHDYGWGYSDEPPGTQYHPAPNVWMIGRWTDETIPQMYKVV